jgi:hypothetical protein
MLMCLYTVRSLLILQELAVYSAQQSKNVTTAAITAAVPLALEVSNTEPAKGELESADQLSATSQVEHCSAVTQVTAADDDVVSDVVSHVRGDQQEDASYGLTINAKQRDIEESFTNDPTATPTGAHDDVPQTRRVEVTGTEPATLEIEFADHLTTLGQTEHNVVAKLSTDEQCDGITAADVAIDVADDASTNESPLAVGSTEPVEAVLVLEQQQQQVLETAKVSI